MTVEKLLKRLKLGDKAVLGEIFKELKTPVFSAALSVLRNRADAEDVSQDVFIKLMDAAWQYKGGSGKAFIVTIARNTALNFLKRKNRETLVDFTESPNIKTTESFADNSIDGIILKDALSLLPDSLREVVLLKNAGLKHKEIAEVLSLPTGTVCYQYSEGIKRLKVILGGEKSE